MNEQSNTIGSQGSHSSENIDPSLPSYLVEAALDREWERRHRQGHLKNAQRTSAEEDIMS